MALGVEQGDAGRGVLHRETQPLLRGRQGRLGALLRLACLHLPLDVAPAAHQAPHVSTGSENRSQGHRDPAAAPLPHPVHGLPHPVHGLPQPSPVGLEQQGLDGPSLQLTGVMAEHLTHRWGDPVDPSVPVAAEDHIRGVFGQQLVVLLELPIAALLGLKLPGQMHRHPGHADQADQPQHQLQRRDPGRLKRPDDGQPDGQTREPAHLARRGERGRQNHGDPVVLEQGDSHGSGKHQIHQKEADQSNSRDDESFATARLGLGLMIWTDEGDSQSPGAHATTLVVAS
jgi:hypothetical protein